MKRLWLLYERSDLALNRDYAAMMTELGAGRGMEISPVTLDELTLEMSGQGEPFIKRNGREARPDGVLSRMRLPLYSRHLEAMGVPVFNGAEVCRICNDKRDTHQFLEGLPMPASRFIDSFSPPPESYPVIVKPACSHGGDRVTLVSDEAAWRLAMGTIAPRPMLEQAVTAYPGRDLRVYVVFGQIVAAVMRTARSGVVSNFKLGGQAALHALSPEEEMLAVQVIERFEAAHAPLCFAGVDLLYDRHGPVIGEVEDVVGSRMLYQTSTIDIAALFLDRLLSKV